MMIDLTTPVAAVSRVGKTTASRLKRLGIETVSDLIFYYPFRWQDFSQISDISELQPIDAATVKVKIQIISNRRSPAKRKMLTEALVADQTGSIKVIWFNQPFLTKILQPGDEVYLSGKVDFDRYNLQLVNPVYEKVSADTTHTARLVPVYSVTNNLTQKQIRFLVKSVLPLATLIADWLPPEISQENNLVNLNLALNQIHFPKDKKILDLAINRLKFDELFLFQLSVLASKLDIALSQSEAIDFFESQTKNFVASLPFTLTNDQRKVAWQIVSDLQKNQPMNRLLQGDVGSGKTVVAAIAMFNVALNKKQAVLMAPTEILASQHYQNLLNLFKDSNLNIALFTRSQRQVNGRVETKKKILSDLSSGDIQLVIGTHALIQQDVEFSNLVLAIVDEQHRFGVNQRKILRQNSGDKKITPHLLSMTATPIPRSLALTLYGDLDLSIIREMPKSRKKIITKVVDPKNRKQAYEFVRNQVKTGRQVFVICPLIDLSDKLGVKAVTDEFEKLKKEIFPDLRIEMLHGKLKPADKERIMANFLAKKSDILVATSVVEVGVDIPNASVMVIEGAERFGLAQLHQFRGRVGRSIYQSYCFLFTESQTEKTKARLNALVTAKDGFELAELDLQFRGPGEIYGTIQSGFPEFKIAQLIDYDIIIKAKLAAEKVLALGLDKYPLLKQKMEQTNKAVHLE
ncbi:MAG: ATP-dependent DNA helicase RecG [Patescibacteria group bacterium]